MIQTVTKTVTMIGAHDNKGDISYIFTNLVSMAMIIKARNYIENDTDSYKDSDDDRRSR